MNSFYSPAGARPALRWEQGNKFYFNVEPLNNRAMCLVTKQKKARIATRDIICYKLVRCTQIEQRTAFQSENLKEADLVESCFRTFTWYPNQLNTTELSCEVGVLENVEYFDSQTRGYLDKIARDNPRALFSVVGRGFHASLTKKRLKTPRSDYLIGTFVIPRGSEIFTDGANGLIVSNKMMWLGY